MTRWSARSDVLRPRTRRPSVGPILLPLRLFLGGTFVFAGLQKLADPNFLDDNAPSGIHQQLVAATHHSPIGGLLAHFTGASVAIGLLIAFGELAVGVGTVLGLWTRLAALGGVLISMAFLLAVSWHTHPYYLGPDIVFVCAWIPIAAAGAPDRFSLDSQIAARARRELRLPPAGRVEIDFAEVRSLCGSYAKGRCDRLAGASCAPAPCPVLAATPRLSAGAAANLDRREFLGAARTAGVVALTGGAIAAAVAATGRGLHSSGARSATALRPPPRGSQPTTSTTPGASTATAVTPPNPPGTAIGAAADLPVGRAGSFTDPYSGQPAIALQPVTDQFRCFSAVCTHAGCTVDYQGGRFVCPCHGAEFDATSGAVLVGPANSPLTTIQIAKGPDGQLYVTS